MREEGGMRIEQRNKRRKEEEVEEGNQALTVLLRSEKKL